MKADLEWQARSLCNGMDPDEIEAVFFPHPNDLALEAKAICVQCPVAEACLTYALETKQDHGVWGCMTEHERARLLNKSFERRPNLPTIHPVRCGTYSGVSRHRKLAEQFCDECRDARNAYEAARKRRLTAERQETA